MNDSIIKILSEIYKGKLDANKAVEEMMIYSSPEQMAEFIVDAFNRGWITPFNIGLSDTGDPY